VHLSLIQWTSVGLALLSTLIAAAIVGILIRSKRSSEFRLFLGYSVTYIAIVVIGLVAFFLTSCQITGCEQYMYVLQVLSFVFMALEFAVMYEIFVNAMRSYSALVDLGKMLFTWATAFLFIAAAITAFATSGPQSSRLVAAYAVVERSMRLMECGLLMLFFFFEKRLALPWRNPNVSIALGLGATASVDLMLSYLKGRFPEQIPVFDLVNSSVYIGVLCFWCYSLAAARVGAKSTAVPANRLVLQRWNEAMTAYGYGSSASASASNVESFLPGIERTVDRVLARKAMH